LLVILVDRAGFVSRPFLDSFNFPQPKNLPKMPKKGINYLKSEGKVLRIRHSKIKKVRSLSRETRTSFPSTSIPHADHTMPPFGGMGIHAEAVCYRIDMELLI
jgi:hypothetical protein